HRSYCHGYHYHSSRRRHTRWPRDWSSDVCSSDLSSATNGRGRAVCPDAALRHLRPRAVRRAAARRSVLRPEERPVPDGRQPLAQIGRASCSESVLWSLYAVELLVYEWGTQFGATI